MPLLTNKKATATTPHLVTIIVDDSNSMQGLLQSGKSKSQVATDSINELVMTTQAYSLGTTGFRFLWNIVKFGDQVTPIAEAQTPRNVNLKQLVFRGDSGWTVMAPALEWAAGALEKAIAVCRKLPVFDESNSPPPIVIFMSDGDNTGPDVRDAARKLRSIQFGGGPVTVIACGIGMHEEHLEILRSIASSPEFAMNINPSLLPDFIAAVGATFIRRDERQLEGFVPDNWDAQMALGRAAMSDSRWPEAEKAFATALNHVRDAGDHRLAATLTALASLHAAQGDWAQSLPFTKDALDLLARLGQTTALASGLESAGTVAELLELANQTDDAKFLWIKIAALWESRNAAGLSGGSSKLVASGFRDLRENRLSAAQVSLEQVAAMGGPGVLAALKGLAQINAETNGRSAAEPYLERLLEEVAKRFGNAHVLTRNAVAAMRSSYALVGRQDKIIQLNQKYHLR